MWYFKMTATKEKKAEETLRKIVEDLKSSPSVLLQIVRMKIRDFISDPAKKNELENNERRLRIINVLISSYEEKLKK